jgi:glucose-6-phosphate 1-dehydrogenase
MGVNLGPGDLPAYGQVLAGVLAGDPTLSVRGDQAVQTWRIVEPVLRAWRDNAVPLEDYEAGSDGPTVPLGAG